MITVYYGAFNISSISTGINHEEPEPLLKNLVATEFYKNLGNRPRAINFMKCPAFKDYINNTYSLKFPFDYDLEYKRMADGYKIIADESLQPQFVMESLVDRDVETRFITFNAGYLFFADQSLDMELLPPFLHNSKFHRDAIFVPGVFDIGKWFRIVDCTFFSLEEKMNIRTGDVFGYAKFNTKEKIQFKRFFVTPEIFKLQSECVLSSQMQKSKNVLSDYYAKFKRANMRNYVLKKIKENIME